MRCPTLSELPPPPPGKAGWPWTEESPQLPDTMPDGSPWPRVSIVTPSYNQAKFIEETIRSVLLQGYPDLEYIIIDGGSTDGSVDIIRKYEPWLAYWVSEPDRGQSHAINKGWQRSTGEILAWLNSDDLYTAGAVGKAVEALQANPEGAMVYSDCFVIDENGEHLNNWVSRPFDLVTLLTRGCYIPQPTVFICRDILERTDWLNESLQVIMDFDLWLRIGVQTRSAVLYLPGIYSAKYRLHPTAKTATLHERWRFEAFRVYERFFNSELIPREIVAVQPLVYSREYLKYAVAKAQRRQGLAALHYLLKALYTHPKYVAGRPLDTLCVLKEVALGLMRRIVGS